MKEERLLMEKTVFVPYAYQPIFETVQADRVMGYEALIRPVGMTPAEYIAKKVREGSTEELEYSSFVNAICQFKQRRLSGRLFINSFPYIILEDEKLDYIKNLAGAMYREIFVENLEYGLMVDAARLSRKYEGIRRMGFRVVLDDYGAGINSVKALTAIDPEIVKIDRSFISGCTDSVKGRNTIEIICDSIRSHNAKVLAEGVETKDEYDYLKTLKVDYMQGFYLGRPE